MNALNKIIKKDPLLIADDDHPARKDMSEKEFIEAIKAMLKRYGRKKQRDLGKRSEFSQAIIDSLNGL